MLTHARAVLGIDAAWTATQPSGIALVVETGSGWRLVTAQASYQRFLAAAHGHRAEPRPAGCLPDVPALLAACTQLHANGPDLVAVDMPLSLQPITARRPCDNLLSQAYAARHCGTHSPTAVRPGPISDALRAGFTAAGYTLATSGQPRRALIEVYPHPALLELAGAAKRLPYKAGKTSLYWPALTRGERKLRLLAEWRRIISLLDAKISGTAASLPPPPPDASALELKAYEDRMDAVVCAWIGICALNGEAVSFGDTTSAIWVPRPTHRLLTSPAAPSPDA